MDGQTEANFGHRIALLEQKISHLYEILQRDEPDFENAGVSDEVLMLVQQDRVIDAIKLHAQQTGCGLAEAKDAIDRIA